MPARVPGAADLSIPAFASPCHGDEDDEQEDDSRNEDALGGAVGDDVLKQGAGKESAGEGEPALGGERGERVRHGRSLRFWV